MEVAYPEHPLLEVAQTQEMHALGHDPPRSKRPLASKSYTMPKAFPNTHAFGLLFGLEKKRTRSKTEIMALALQDELFDPTKLIAPSPLKVDQTQQGWRKTFKWTNARGMKFKISAGEGPMYEELV